MYLTKKQKSKIRILLANYYINMDLAYLEKVADAVGIEWHDILDTAEILEVYWKKGNEEGI